MKDRDFILVVLGFCLGALVCIAAVKLAGMEAPTKWKTSGVISHKENSYLLLDIHDALKREWMNK